MAAEKKATTGHKKSSASDTIRLKKTISDINAEIVKPGSFLNRRGGMVPTVRLGKGASQKIL